MRLKDKIAIVVGGGQQSGETIGNGRATCLRFAQEGATVLVVDYDLASAEDTVKMITDEGGQASALNKSAFGLLGRTRAQGGRARNGQGPGRGRVALRQPQACIV